MGKEVVVKGESELVEGSLNGQALAAVGSYDAALFEGVDMDITDNKELFANDIVVPKIWLIQAMSELRKSKKADEGDYANSRTEEILLPLDGDVEFLPFIPLKTFKRIQTFKLVVGGKREFVKSEVMILGENDNLAYEETIDGIDYVRRQVISVYVLLGEEAQKGIIRPFILDFASTSKGAGRDLVSDIKVLNAKKIPSFAAWFKLSKKEQSNDQGDFFVKVVKFGGMLPEAMMPFLKEAYDEVSIMINNNTIEIDDRDVRGAAKEEISKERNDNDNV